MGEILTIVRKGVGLIFQQKKCNVLSSASPLAIPNGPSV